jgi:hypothetical protein
MGQQPISTTPIVLIQVQGKQAIALIDSGSSNSFMDLSFAIKSNCLLQAAKARDVKVAGGGLLTSDSVGS